MRVVVAPEARQELVDGAIFYAKEANAELGLAFIEEFERAINVITAHPGLGTPWRAVTRRFPLRRFPFNVIYRTEGEDLRVIALAHQRRRPDYWSGRT